jgi:Tfp pilus assembly protein PilO
MTKERRWVTIAAVIVVVILAGGWFLLVKSEKSKVTDLHTQRDTQLSANQSLITQIRALQAQQKQLPQQQLVLEKFSTQVPDSAAEPTLIRQLSAAAKGAGVDLTTITPGGPTAVAVAAPTGQSLGGGSAAAAPLLYSLPLNLAITGSYANIEAFFNGLERLPRALIVNTFSVSPGGGDGEGTANTLTAGLTGSVFFAPGTAPITVPVPTTAPEPATSNPPAPTTTDTAAPLTGGAQPAGSPTAPGAEISRPPFSPVQAG